MSLDQNLQTLNTVTFLVKAYINSAVTLYGTFHLPKGPRLEKGGSQLGIQTYLANRCRFHKCTSLCATLAAIQCCECSLLCVLV